MKNGEIIKKIENIYDELIADKECEYYKMLKSIYCRNVKPKISEAYLITSKILSEQGFKTSETTVYRIIKVRNANSEIYTELINGNLEIKEAYEKCFPPKKDGDASKRRNKRYLSMSEMISISKEINESIEDILYKDHDVLKKDKILKKIDSIISDIEQYYNSDSSIFNLEDDF